jgi:hypothetical protein
VCLGKPARGLPKPTPPPPCGVWIWRFNTWRNAKLSLQNAQVRCPNGTSDLDRGERWTPLFKNSTMKQYFKMLINMASMCISYPLLTAVSNCAHLLSACCKEESGVLYSEAEPIKGPQNWSPVLSRLHSILQATSLQRTVYIRTKSATTTHVEL